MLCAFVGDLAQQPDLKQTCCEGDRGFPNVSFQPLPFAKDVSSHSALHPLVRKLGSMSDGNSSRDFWRHANQSVAFWLIVFVRFCIVFLCGGMVGGTCQVFRFLPKFTLKSSFL